MQIFERARKETLRFDVVVVGSGSAGSVAAIASARAGAKTLLIERLGFLGGISTGVLDTFYGFYTPGERARKVVGGIGDSVVGMLREYGCCLERPNTYGAGTGITYNSEYLKVVWERLVRGAGASVLLNGWIQDATVRSGRVEHLVAATKMGLVTVHGDVYVDASGDADLAYFAGVPCELAGEHEHAQSLTTTFKAVNVDVARRASLSKDEFHLRMADAAESGRYSLPRREGSDHITPVAGMMATNMTRVHSFELRDGQFRNATDPEFLSMAEIEGRKQALEYFRFLRTEIPGYEHADLVSLSTQIGVRESRRILGKYRLTGEDVLAARKFEDQIGLCGAPIEDHRPGSDTKWQYLPEGECVGIPYRTLVPQSIENLLAAGRCFSATHHAHASVRSMGQCMAMGQAAGTAAALCAADGVAVPALRAELLRGRLRSDGAIVDLE